VGIHNYSGFPEGVSQDHIGGFSPDAGQGRELLHRCGNLAVESVRDRLAARHEVFGLAFEKPGRSDHCLDLGKARTRVVSGPAIATKEVRRHLINALIRALGGEDRRDQQFPWCAMVEFDLHRRDGLLECIEKLTHARLRTSGGGLHGYGWWRWSSIVKRLRTRSKGRDLVRLLCRSRVGDRAQSS
jgi:hypothetical protein